MSHPDPLKDGYHSDLIFADQQTELGSCAVCGLIQARHQFAVVDWDEGTILACGECVTRENLRIE